MNVRLQIDIAWQIKNELEAIERQLIRLAMTSRESDVAPFDLIASSASKIHEIEVYIQARIDELKNLGGSK